MATGQGWNEVQGDRVNQEHPTYASGNPSFPGEGSIEGFPLEVLGGAQGHIVGGVEKREADFLLSFPLTFLRVFSIPYC